MAASGPKVNETSLSSFNSNHELYDKYRPDFPGAAVDGLVTKLMALTLGKSRILEVASGTGKFTRALVTRGFCGKTSSGDDLLVAAEPSQGMIDSFVKNFPDVPVVQTSAFELAAQFPGAAFDAVIAAQAFHWFGVPAALREFAHVLKPAGKLGLVWNYEDIEGLDSDNWQVKITHYIWSFDGDVPQYRRMEWVKAFHDKTPDGEGPFFETPYEELTVQFELVMPRDTVWPYWRSRSYITALPEEKQEEIRKNVEAIVYGNIPAQDLAPNGKDLIVRRATHVVCATKKS